tara:strand:+ start:140 stop:463 length:324 start_codon:yes stop_codon:yes gene_type:complete
MPQGKGTYGSKRGRPAKNSPTMKKKSAPKKKETIKIGKEKITIKKDALRNMLSVPKDEDIPVSLLNKIKSAEVGDMVMNPFTKKNMKITALIKKRASLAKTLKGFKK